MESVSKPSFINNYIIGGVRHYDININIEYDGASYKWEQIHLNDGVWTYSGIVDALVQYKYPIDKMQAVINNYLLDPNDAYAIDEFNKMQAWRKEAKEIAKEALTYGVS